MLLRDYLSTLLAQVAFSSPLMITWIAGIILAIVTWKKHPRASLLALLSFVISIFKTLIFSVTPFLTVYLNYNLGLPATRISEIMLIVNFVSEIISVVCWILVIIAIFARRKEKDTEVIQLEKDLS